MSKGRKSREEHCRIKGKNNSLKDIRRGTYRQHHDKGITDKQPDVGRVNNCLYEGSAHTATVLSSLKVAIYLLLIIYYCCE
jgi:hypothetical protein